MRRCDQGIHKTSIRIFSERALNSFAGAIALIPWEAICNRGDAQSAYDMFFKCFNHEYNMNFPLKRFKIRKRIRKPYITPEILAHMEHRDSLFKKHLKKRTDESKAAFKLYRNKVNKMVERAKQKFVAPDTKPYDTRKVWRNINEFLGRKKQVRLPAGDNADDQSGEIERLELVANRFNDYYVREAVPQTSITDERYKAYLPEQTLRSFFLEPTDAVEVLNCILGLKNTKSVGVDDIRVIALKRVAGIVAPGIATLINLCFNTGVFPDPLKIAKIIPIYKGKGSCNEMSNYRPISLLPLLSKVFERLIYSRLYQYFEKYNLLADAQDAYRKGRSTELTLLDVKEHILTQMQKKNIVVGLFCDFSKAFDTVNHRILLDKLSVYGIRGPALHLLTSYLNRRQQCVAIKDSTSRLLSIERGVPQGSILGPLLFLVYINDLVRIDSTLFYKIFADDSNSFFSGRSVSAIQPHIQSFVCELTTWCRSNALIVNPSKTKLVIFRPKNKKLDQDLAIVMDGYDLEVVDEAKFLGVWLDKHLTWSKHVLELCKKLRRVCGLINRNRYVFPFKVKRLLYFALFYSNLHYCITTYGTTCTTNLSSLHRLQKRFVRALYNLDPRSATKPYFIKAGIIPVDKVYASRIVKTFRHRRLKYMKEKLLELACLEERKSAYNTRCHDSYRIPTYKSNYLQQKMSFQLPVLLNRFNILDYSVPTKLILKKVRDYTGLFN
jgi:hypothetical protein